MHPEAEFDTRSPWYEAFVPHTRPHGAGVRWIAVSVDEAADEAPRSATADTEQSTEELFDCYNG